MLASTVQFSTYDRSLPDHPRRTRHLPREARRYENRRAPPEITDPVPRMPAPSGPNSVPTTGPSLSTAFHARLRGPYWRRPERPAELVSVPPSSTTPDACGPPEM